MGVLTGKTAPKQVLKRGENQKDRKRLSPGAENLARCWVAKMASSIAATPNMATRDRSWGKSRESYITGTVRELSRGCGAAKMEQAAGGPGPLIMNNKQPQPPPPPPPSTAQPPPGAPRAGGGLLPGGKAREFNRNQRKDSEVRSFGGRV